MTNVSPRKKLSIIVFLLLPVFTTGCTSNKHSTKIGESFRTRISSSNLKHFELRIRTNKDDTTILEKQSPRKSRQQPRRTNQYKKLENIFTRAAELKLEETGFCRDGFWKLDYDIDFKGPYFRGECYDTASAEDKANFPDTLEQW
ncbi:MAG: hypothetical protein ACI93R_000121 [Flavobacteriales bacterium]